MVSLGSTIGEALLVGADITIARHKAGYDKYLYGVSGAGVTASAGSAFEVDHAGWVGVTTYIDTHGNLRVKERGSVAPRHHKMEQPESRLVTSLYMIPILV